MDNAEIIYWKVFFFFTYVMFGLNYFVWHSDLRNIVFWGVMNIIATIRSDRL